jgi:ABC-type Fe3+ transport system permease subunit
VTTSAVIILTGLVVILGRYWLENKRPTRQSVKGPGEPSTSDGTLVRSWIAIVLVGGLLVFCAVSLSIVGMSSRFGPTVRITFGPTLAETATSNLRG